MRNLKGRSLFGKCLLIFWNIFVISTENEHTTIWEKESPTSAIFNDTVSIILNQEIRELIRPEDGFKTLEYHHKSDNGQFISFIISTCKTTEIQWVLKYKPENETSKVTNQNSQSQVLKEYKGALPHSYVGEARRGIYLVEIRSTSKNQMYFLYASMVSMDIDFFNRSENIKREGKITFKKNLKDSTITFRWPEWLRNQEIAYVVALNEKKNVLSGCELENYEWQTTLRYATKKTFYGPVRGRNCYISIFIKTKNDFLLPYLHGHVTFPKSSPHTLRDGEPAKMKLGPDDTKLTFRYKVRNNRFPESENEILWYVISCDGPVQIEINHKRDTVLKKQLVTQYKMFKTSKPNTGNRYVLKVTGASDISQNDGFNGNIEVFATMRSKLFPFPNVTNLNLRLYRKRKENSDVENKVSYVVELSTASDKEKVRYCMRIFSKIDKTNNYDWEINHCTKMKKKLENIGNFVARNCTTPSKKKSIIRLSINDLDPQTDYVVYVSARKPGVKHRIWYNTLFVSGNNSTNISES